MSFMHFVSVGSTAPATLRARVTIWVYLRWVVSWALFTPIVSHSHTVIRMRVRENNPELLLCPTADPFVNIPLPLCWLCHGSESRQLNRRSVLQGIDRLCVIPRRAPSHKDRGFPRMLTSTLRTCHCLAMSTIWGSVACCSWSNHFCNLVSFTPRTSSTLSQSLPVIAPRSHSTAIAFFLSHHVLNDSPGACLHTVKSQRRFING